MSAHSQSIAQPPTPSPRSLASLFLRGLDPQIEADPISFQPLPLTLSLEGHSFLPRSARGAKTPGCHQERSLISRRSPLVTRYTFTLSFEGPLTPLGAILTADFSVLAEISRSCPLATSLDATLTDSAPVTPLSATLTKNIGEGGSLCVLPTCFQPPMPLLYTVTRPNGPTT